MQLLNTQKPGPSCESGLHAIIASNVLLHSAGGDGGGRGGGGEMCKQYDRVWLGPAHT